ncbi:MAG: hypothetical protein OEZ34_01430 [Spirochaetia bacterium]|nr:hypothetical protein [Spirochaetia bacterium]
MKTISLNLSLIFLFTLNCVNQNRKINFAEDPDPACAHHYIKSVRAARSQYLDHIWTGELIIGGLIFSKAVIPAGFLYGMTVWSVNKAKVKYHTKKMIQLNCKFE